MKRAILMLLFAAASFGQQQKPIQDLNQLVGKQVIIQRTGALCQPGTFTMVFTYYGKQAQVISLKPSNLHFSNMPQAFRDMHAGEATILVQFEDGKQLDTCAPVTARNLSDHFELAPGETVQPIPQAGTGGSEGPASSTVVLPPAPIQEAGPAKYLSTDEIKAATTIPPGAGFVEIEDAGFSTPSSCQAQMPVEYIYSPAGWLNALSLNARRAYLPFEPAADDTLRALTVISRGCASGSPAGPVCDSITRTVLISDKSGNQVAEAVESHDLAKSWQNGFGATATCSSLVSRFLLTDVKRVRNGKGEFQVATFSGQTPLKVYTVKLKHLKKLGI